MVQTMEKTTTVTETYCQKEGIIATHTAEIVSLKENQADFKDALKDIRNDIGHIKDAVIRVSWVIIFGIFSYLGIQVFIHITTP